MKLRELRRAARLTQLELALKTGISRVRLSQAECGYLELSDDERTALRLAIEQVLDLRADDLRRQLEVIGQGGAK